MTVVVAVASPDGIILASESRTTVQIGERHRTVSDNAQKVFPLFDRIGVATYGMAFIGERTIAGLMDEFVATLEDGEAGASDIAAELGQFFDAKFRDAVPAEQVEELEQKEIYPLGFLVAGYDDDGIGRVTEWAVPGPAQPNDVVINTASRGVLWRGQTDVIRRLIKGADIDLLLSLDVAVPDEVGDALLSLEYSLIFPITLQDAVDFASFLIRTTIDMQRFSDGTTANPGDLPGCGGPIRILSVQPYNTEWVTEPGLIGSSTPGMAEGGLGSY